MRTARRQSRCTRWVELGFRVATSLIFVVAGGGHLVRTDRMIEKLTEAPLGRRLADLGVAEPLMLASGLVLLVGGLALALGYRTRQAALLLLGVLVPITITAHVGHGSDPGPLLKNVALIGSLAHFAALGGYATRNDA